MKKYPFKSIKLDAWVDGRPPESLVDFVLRGMLTYPYFVRLKGFPVGCDTADHLSSLILGLEKRVGYKGDKAVSFTKVTINDRQANKDRPVTAYSRTAEALAPHTDSTYLPNPHDIVAFQCEIADGVGGDTYMVPVDDVVNNLEEKIEIALTESHYDFGRGKHAILHTNADNQTEIRYYRAQLDHIAMRNQVQLPANVLHALDQLDELLMNANMAYRFKLAPGEAVIMMNKRVLHARDSFQSDSDRTFYRIRRHLELGGLSAKANVFQVFLSWLKSFSLLQKRKAVVSAPIKGGDLDGNTVSEAKKAAKRGDFVKAKILYSEILAANPQHYESLLALSAMAYRESALVESEAYRRRFCEYHLFSRVPKSKSHLPIVLKARALKGIKYTYKKGKTDYRRTLHRGHFSLSNFFSGDVCYLQNLNVYDQSTPVMEPAPRGVGVMINTIACGDRMADSLSSLGQFLTANPGLSVINDPSEVAKTTRAENYRVLNSLEGVTFPRTEAVDHDGSEDSLINIKALIKAGFEFPVMIRPRFTHTGSGLELVKSYEDVTAYFSGHQDETYFYIIQWKNLRNSDGHYNKIRTFCIDGTYYPIAHLMHTGWNVHSGDRYSVMHKTPALQTLEQAYLNDMSGFLGKAAMDALSRIREHVKLDFFGIDFTLLKDGSLYVFECNAAMRHNYDHAGTFPYTRKTLNAATEAFEEMVRNRLGI